MNPCRLVLLVGACAACFASGCASQIANRRCQVSLPVESVPPAHRVVGISITLSNAWFNSLPIIPEGWTFSLDNDPSGSSRLSGVAVVGAAALDGHDAFLRQSIGLLRVDEGMNAESVNCHIELTATRDFDPDHVTNVVRAITILPRNGRKH